MSDLTRNLSRFEFRCKGENCDGKGNNCGFDTVDFELVKAIQDSADHFAITDGINVRIDITGPNRCAKHNAEVGGADNSQHIYARAADFKLFNRLTGDQIDPERVSHYLGQRYPRKFGIGRYDNRTHLDTRSNGPARWKKTSD